MYTLVYKSYRKFYGFGIVIITHLAMFLLQGLPCDIYVQSFFFSDFIQREVATSLSADLCSPWGEAITRSSVFGIICHPFNVSNWNSQLNIPVIQCLWRGLNCRIILHMYYPGENVNEWIGKALLEPCTRKWSKFAVYQEGQLQRRLLRGSITMVTGNKK